MAEFAFGKLPIAMASGSEIAEQVAVAAVFWYNPAAANDTFMLTDASGHLLARDICVTAHQSIYRPFPLPIECNGLGVGQLSSGVLYVYLA